MTAHLTHGEAVRIGYIQEVLGPESLTEVMHRAGVIPLTPLIVMFRWHRENAIVAPSSNAVWLPAKGTLGRLREWVLVNASAVLMIPLTSEVSVVVPVVAVTYGRLLGWVILDSPVGAPPLVARRHHLLHDEMTADMLDAAMRRPPLSLRAMLPSTAHCVDVPPMRNGRFGADHLPGCTCHTWELAVARIC